MNDERKNDESEDKPEEHGENFTEEKVPVVVLTADDLLNATLRTKDINIPILGGKVLARELNGAQRDDYERLCAQGKHKGDDYRSLRARLVIMSLEGEGGKKLLDIKQLGAVNRMPAAILDRLFDTLLEFNGMSPDAEENAEADFGKAPAS